MKSTVTLWLPSVRWSPVIRKRYSLVVPIRDGALLVSSVTVLPLGGVRSNSAAKSRTDAGSMAKPVGASSKATLRNVALVSAMVCCEPLAVFGSVLNDQVCGRKVTVTSPATNSPSIQ